MVAASDSGRASPQPFAVVWTRGKGCAELAAALDAGTPTRVMGDLRDACVAARADLLVTRRLVTSFDFVSVAVPHDFQPGRVASVSAAVSSGPHSELAARLALRLGESLGVEAEMVSAYPSREFLRSAGEIVESLAARIPGLPFRVVETPGAAELVARLPPDSLLVLGAAGGTWLQRAFFGPGVRLLHRAPAGAVVVQQGPVRVYHRISEPSYVGRHLLAGDALRTMAFPVEAVLEEGALVGLVRRSVLEAAGSETSVGDVMEEPVFLMEHDRLADAAEVIDWMEGSPVPVVDETMRLVGSVDAAGATR